MFLWKSLMTPLSQGTSKCGNYFGISTSSHTRVKNQTIISQWPIKATPFFSFNAIVRQRIIRFVRWGSIMRSIHYTATTSPFSWNTTKTIYLPLQFWAQEAPYNWFGLNMYIISTVLQHFTRERRVISFFYVILPRFSKYHIISPHVILGSNANEHFVYFTHLKLNTA